MSARADNTFLDTGLGRVEVDVPADIGSYRSSLRCITANTFQIAESLAKELYLIDGVLPRTAHWKIRYMESFRSSSLRMRSGESALFHTAVMNPPADIYVDLSSFRDASHSIRAQSGEVCTGWSRSLVTTLIHEIGHGLEFALMGPAISHRLRWHAEGFATWFEGEYRRRYLGEVRTAQQPLDPSIVYLFSAGSADYAAAAGIFESIIDVIGVNDLRSVYSRMSRENSTFERALRGETGISLPIYLWMARNSAIYFK